MFRFVIAMLAAFGLGALIFGGNAATAAGLVLLAPLFFIFKVMLFFLLFGAISSAMWRGGRGPGPRRWAAHHGWHEADRSRSAERSTPSEEDRFEEWHRMAHAREEVDSWIADEA